MDESYIIFKKYTTLLSGLPNTETLTKLCYGLFNGVASYHHIIAWESGYKSAINSLENIFI